jgi:hypothetical protein
VKHPFAVGLGVGAAGLLLWWRRAWVKGLFARMQNPLHGLGAVQMHGAAGAALRHIRRYTFASMQDQSPIVGLTHASYALSGLDLLEEAAGPETIVAAGFDPNKVRDLITKLQDQHALKLHHADPYITQVLGMQAGFALAGPAPDGA